VIGLLLAFKKEETIDVSAHADEVTTLILYAIALLIGFFVVRPELWRRIFLVRVDPRPAALMRIFFGFVVFWTFLDLLANFRFLFTDEGLWLTDMARRNYGGELKKLWDPEQGFEHWYDFFKALWSRMSILHFRSDPTFVGSIYAVMMAAILCMILGFKTRIATLVAWILVEQIYRYSPVFYTGGDTVTRVFLFLGVFVNWGQAYSIDSWWRRRKAILSGERTIPPLRKIAAWPMRLMWLQLSIIYCATGLLKSGSTWANGSALYYALNLDHFYRWPQTGLVGAAHFSGILPITSIVVHWWEILFPLVIVGVAVNTYERERKDGSWPKAAIWRRVLSWAAILAAWGIGAHIAGIGAHYYLFPENPAPWGIPREQLIPQVRMAVAAVPAVIVALYLLLRRFAPPVFDFIRKWLLGRRLWLVIGFNMHVGIDLSMNVGVFANVMMSVYAVWLTGPEVDAFWKYAFSRPMDPKDRPSQVDREEAMHKWFRRLPAKIRGAMFWASRRFGVDRLVYRQPGQRYTIVHRSNDAAIRHAALLRCWDLGNRLAFEVDEDDDGEGQGPLKLRIEGAKKVLTGSEAGRALIKIFPGLWLFRPFRWLPGLGPMLGNVAMRILRQK